MKFDEKTTARAKGNNLPISFKKSVEVCTAIRQKPLLKAIVMLEDIADMKKALPHKRFNKGGTGHKVGMGPGRYPVKACNEIIDVLKNAEANARQKGLTEGELIITYAVANKASQQFHFGRQRRRKMKRTNIDIVVEEVEKKATPKKEVPKVEEKPKAAEVKAAKPEVKKEAPKPVEKKETPAKKAETPKAEPKKEVKPKAAEPAKEAPAKAQKPKAEKAAENKQAPKDDKQ